MPGWLMGLTPVGVSAKRWYPWASSLLGRPQALDDLEARDVDGVHRLLALGDLLVGEDDHRRLVLLGEVEGLHREAEGVRDAGRREHRTEHVAVGAERRLEEVRLLGLGRQSGGGAAALHVEQDQRQLGDGGQAQHLGLERHARAARWRSSTSCPRTRRPRPRPCRLISSSAWRTDAAVLPQLAGEDLHHLGGRGDGVAAEELAAGEERAAAHISLPSHEQLRLRARPGGPARAAARAGARWRRRGQRRAPSRFASSSPSPFLANFFSSPRSSASRGTPNQPGEHAEHDAGLGPVGARGGLGELGQRHRADLPGELAGRA